MSFISQTSNDSVPYLTGFRLYDGADAKNAVIPHVVLASKEESTDVTAEYKAAFDKSTLGSYVDTYATMHHGWMGARANLEDPENKKEYYRG